jgi:hypothetical protein
MSKQFVQLSLFELPTITLTHGQEWIRASDSTGQQRFFSRKVGSTKPFFADNGEYVNEFGQLVDESWNLIQGLDSL